MGATDSVNLDKNHLSEIEEGLCSNYFCTMNMAMDMTNNIKIGGAVSHCTIGGDVQFIMYNLQCIIVYQRDYKD